MRWRSEAREHSSRIGRTRASQRTFVPKARRAIAALCVLGVVSALTACANARADRVPAGPHFVTPPLIRYSSVLWPVPLELVGGEPGARLRISASLTTSRGVWRSGATYAVPASGVLDLATARPQLAPFAEPDSAGLFWSLRGPELSPEEAAQQWMRETNPVTLTARDGDRVVASRTFRLQGLAAVLRSRTVSTRDLSFSVAERLPHHTSEDEPVGRFWSASPLERPVSPAVLMFDDPTLGASADFVAPLVAQFGAAVFVLPVSADEGSGKPAGEGLRATDVRDAETIGAVLDWLRKRETVDAQKLFVYGTGAAEPLAVWAATRFPSRVHGLFAGSGSPALLCLPAGDPAPIQENGVSLPCQYRPGINPGLTLASVNGPVVLACGENDTVFPEVCPAQFALAGTHDSGVDHGGDQVIARARAAHAVTVPPGLPLALPSAGDPSGADAQATQRARIAFWNAVGQILLRAALA